jgi:murein DD-endopeptidase MepM/ murein hydrolase activator NlpD
VFGLAGGLAACVQGVVAAPRVEALPVASAEPSPQVDVPATTPPVASSPSKPPTIVPPAQPTRTVFRIKGETSPILKEPARVIGNFGYRADPFTGKTAFHAAIDLAASWGAPIYAPAEGVVAFAGVRGSYGRVVELDLGDGVAMRFGHLNAITVKAGAEVKAGDKIGTMGSTGRSTGPHLHFEYLRDGKNYDPQLVENLVLATSLEIDLQAPPGPPAPTSVPDAGARLIPTQFNPAPAEMTVIRVPFNARVISVEPLSGGKSAVRLQQVASRDRPLVGEGCVALYVDVENERISGHAAPVIGEGHVVGFAPAASLTNAVSCPAGVTGLVPQTGQKIDYRISNAPRAVVRAPARPTSGFGIRMDPFTRKEAFHGGADIAAYQGAPIHTPGDGIISFADTKDLFGKTVEVDIGGGYLLRMGQLAEISVKAGDRVKAGDVIGTMGSTGRSTGPHLHLEVLVNDEQVNPELVHGLTLIGAR